MNYIRIVVIIVTAFAYNPSMQGDEIITLFIKPYPIIPNTDYSQEVEKSFSKPETASRSYDNNALSDINVGIFSTYRGYLATSDYNGQISYPRQQDQAVIKILVTTRLTPNIITGNTIHHWELETDTPAQLYEITRQKDPYSGLSFWKTKQIPLPEDMRISLNTIVIFAHPKYIEIPIGITLSDESKPNMILPDIYIKEGIKNINNVLYVLNIRQFFGPVKFLRQKQEKAYQTLIVPHPGY